MGSHLINKEGNNRPPEQCASNDKGVTDDNVIKLVFGQRETEAGKQRDNQEHDERIAQREQEACHHITQVIVALVEVLLDLADRVVHDHVDGVHDEDDTSYNLQHIDVVGNEIGYERDAQPDQKTVEQVACRSPNTGEKTGIAPTVKCALNTQDTNRTHRSR